MAKKPKVPEHENLERWMVSYADLLTLLFALFVILYGFAMSAQTEVKSIVQGLVQSFADMGFVTARPGSAALVGNMGIDGTTSSEYLSNISQKDIPIVNAPVEGAGGVLDFGASLKSNVTNSPNDDTNEKTEKDDTEGSAKFGRDDDTRNDSEIESAVQSESVNGAPLDSIQQEISQNIQELLDEKLVVMTRHESWLTIDFNSYLVFPQGSATILNRFKPVLDKLSETLAGVKNYVHVRGYTDNRYLGDELYKSSWELSSARAISVLNYFADKGVEQQRMAVEAYGEFSPSASNSTKRGREKNRKVVIAVSKYAYNPKPLPIIEDDDVKVNDGNNGKGKSDFKPENYNLIRLPDGTIQLKNKEK